MMICFASKSVGERKSEGIQKSDAEKGNIVFTMKIAEKELSRQTPARIVLQMS